MKVWVVGNLQDESFNREISRRSSELLHDSAVHPRPGSLDIDLLGDVADNAAADRQFIEMLRHKSQIDTQLFSIPRKPGFVGGMLAGIRGFLWKLLRYQHDRMFSRQNRVNAWMVSAFELRTDALRAEINQLRDEVYSVKKSKHDSWQGADQK